MLKNYYKTLGVDILANDEDIKKAYKTLAKKYHPDVNQNDKNAEVMFKEINEAYETLGNSEKRAIYDTQLKYYISIPVKHSDDDSYKKTYAESMHMYNRSNLTKIIIVFLCVLLIGTIVLFFEYNYLKNVKKESLEPGMSIEEVLKIYGEPDEITKEQITYNTSIILLENETVKYWYNYDDTIEIKNYDIEDISDIKIGENIIGIFHDYGYPDTYAKTFIVYYDVVILYNDGKVIEVVKIKIK